MPKPVYEAGTVGNLIAEQTVNSHQTVAAFLDLSSSIEGQITCEVVTGSPAPVNGVTFSIYKVYSNASPFLIEGTVGVGGVSIPLSSVSGIHPGQMILLQQKSGAKLGEVVTTVGVNGNSVTVSPTIHSYSAEDSVFLISQTPTALLMPTSPNGRLAVSSDYSGTIFMGTGQWGVAAHNSDANVPLVVVVSVDQITGYQ